jgi:hypothetical protein
MTPETLTAQLREVEQLREDALDEVACAVRARFVIPACKKHNLRFMSGNGLYDFTPLPTGTDWQSLCAAYLNGSGPHPGQHSDHWFHSAEEAAKKGYDLAEVFAVLDVHVDAVSNIGDLIENYDPKAT